MLRDAPAWYVLGPLLALVLVSLLALVNVRMGVLGGFSDVLDRASGRTRTLGWKGWFVAGIALGGLLFRVLAGTPSTGDVRGTLGHVLDDDVAIGAGLVLAGGLIGYGAKWAGGCTSGNGLTGSSYGSPASLVATATFMATAIAVTLTLEALT